MKLLALPRFAAIKSVFYERCVYYTNDNQELPAGCVRTQEETTFNLNAKIEIEMAKIDPTYIHLRFCQTNKYWTRHDPDNIIVASSDKPEEDASKLSCTLFKPTVSGRDGCYYLTYVPTGKRVRTKSLLPGDTTATSLVYTDGDDDDESESPDSSSSSPYYAFSFVDWDAYVVLPKFVAFKGDNGKYLKSCTIDGEQYLQFSSDDCKDKATAYEVTMTRDGYVHIKSNLVGNFLRCNAADWVCPDSTHDINGNTESLFLPVKVNDTTIALRTAGNNMNFCKRLTSEGKTECVNAAAATITKDAKFQVEEVVSKSEVFDVKYNLENARIFDERDLVLASGHGINTSDKPQKLTLRIVATDSSSFTFSNSLSVASQVKRTIQAGLPRIVQGRVIQVSDDVTMPFEWNKTIWEGKEVEQVFEVELQPQSKVQVNYVATNGKCELPFSYTQKDTLSTDGTVVTTHYTDGVYTGFNYFNNKFTAPQFEPV